VVQRSSAFGHSEVRSLTTPAVVQVSWLSPVFAIAAGWLAGEVAKLVPGAKLDKTQIVAFMITASASALTAAWKRLQGWQQHEQLVAQGLVEPRKAAAPRKL
jgi:hypothetical protein